MMTAISSLAAEDHKDPCIKHALEIRSAWALNNYHKFFRLYSKAPKMSGYLLDWFLERERKAATGHMMRAYVFIKWFSTRTLFLINELFLCRSFQNSQYLSVHIYL